MVIVPCEVPEKLGRFMEIGKETVSDCVDKVVEVLRQRGVVLEDIPALKMVDVPALDTVTMRKNVDHGN